MSDELVTCERRDDGVAVVRLDRGKVNALSGELLDQLASVVADLASDLPGAVMLTGGPKVFAAGADVAEFGGEAEARAIVARFRAAGDGLATLPRMVIAAVNGYALGGGCELAMACDLRIAGQRARFGQPEIGLGIIPGGGGTQRLARLVGPARAKELITTGRQVAADEALRIGLVNEVVADDEATDDAAGDRALALAADLAAGPVAAQALAKTAIDDGLDGPLAAGLDVEAERFVEVFRTDDAGIGIASFREHGPGKATFTGR